ncbi:hypothetical protein MYSTI_06815 [Myxococcus stipitatus DSM 14675]|uniref:NAD(P)-binding domain-containing protein n=1 Tax=Myxococcus stipitatus (strain DSM 14675 / JCM 12634 / Mx s8) TaxID=1278073 RepID=L7UJ95_MYXSD|nr:hypothetical protein [Myxococcus stipitatus]AGC48088.1 hypothetical protein MYSTI_06815 [Myxococcus stipitatus DSM 14675]
MKVVIFGATGMVGAGALREVLASDDVEAVLSISRQPCGVEHPKLREILLSDLFDVAAVEGQLSGYDACIWAIGVSSVGLDEAAYALVTEELTLTWAHTLLRLNPGMAFCYCSAGGAGGPGMWARVRRRVEGALKEMPFRHAGAVRPGFIRPGPGIRSKTRGYQFGITLLKPLFLLVPLLVRVVPGLFTTSERLGRAMLRVVQGRADRFILESADINRVGA